MMSCAGKCDILLRNCGVKALKGSPFHLFTHSWTHSLKHELTHKDPPPEEVFLQSQHSQFTDDSAHTQDNECGCNLSVLWSESARVCVYDNEPGPVRKHSQSVSGSPCCQRYMSRQMVRVYSCRVFACVSSVWWGNILIHVFFVFPSSPLQSLMEVSRHILNM